MTDLIKVFSGWDERERGGYHTFANSVIARSTRPVSIQPVALHQLGGWDRVGGQTLSGSTAFAFSRFLVPYLCGFEGWALWADGADMLCMDDLSKLWALRDDRYALMCVQHDPYSVPAKKMWDQVNRDYPRKNWSSLILWNCGYPANRELLPELVSVADGSYLHQFKWLSDDLIGELPKRWNVLVGHHHEEDAGILHFTEGLPYIHEYARGGSSQLWLDEFSSATYIMRNLK